MISICIPYKPDGGRRDQIFWWVKKRWELLFPSAEIVIGQNDSDPFNRAAARNDAYRRASHKTLVFADADTICPPSLLSVGLARLTNTNWVLPYDAYYNVAEESSDEILRSNPDVELDENEITWEHRIPYPPHPPYGAPVSGIVIMKKGVFEAVGGYDEQFIGWGYEDTDFALAMETLVGPAVRCEGYVFHLWHPTSEDATWASPWIKQNKARHLLYEKASGDKGAMKALKGRSL